MNQGNPYENKGRPVISLSEAVENTPGIAMPCHSRYGKLSRHV